MANLTSIEFDLERTIKAPIDEVFARLVDIDGHNAWVAKDASMLKGTRQTSPGEPTVGTTYVDDTKQGLIHGEIVELQAPHTVVYHWWDRSSAGKLKFEGWPGYTLQSSGANQTLVRHSVRLNAYGLYRLAAPVLKRLAHRERTATIDALKASFESVR